MLMRVRLLVDPQYNSCMKPRKIAMLMRQFSAHGGLELYAHKVVEGLLDSGIAVTVVCQERDSDFSHRQLDFKAIESAPKTKNKRVKLEHLFRSGNETLQELTEVDLIHSQHCPSAHCDVVTFHNHTTARLSKVGLWWEVLLNEKKRKIIPAYRLREKQDEILCRRAHSLIFPAEVMKEDFFQNFPFLEGPPPKPYVVAYPGASLQSSITELSSTSNGLQSAEAFNFLFVGRGFRKKGLDILLQACAILKARTPKKFTLFIAGLRAKTADILRLKMMGLDGYVQYLGFQKDMELVYQKAQSIILPSRVEPFGMAPIQGMQRGLVPIVSKVSGVAEALQNGQDSILLQDQLSASELAQHMLNLMSDPALFQRLCQNAKLSSAKINWEQTVIQTIKAYEIALTVKNSGKTP